MSTTYLGIWPTVELPDLPGAACARPGVDPAWFHPPPPAGKGSVDQHTRNRLLDAARAVCGRCPDGTRTNCLRWAVDHDECGVWGMTTDEDRRYLRGERLKPCPDCGEPTATRSRARRCPECADLARRRQWRDAHRSKAAS